MAKSIGIEIASDAISVAVVDGTAKRFVLNDFVTVPIEREGDDPETQDAAPTPEDITRAIKVAMREIKGKRENLALTIDTSAVVIREHSLPFTGDDRIRQVIKFEMEGKLPQLGIDDVIVDYYVMEESENQSKLLVIAAPKRFVGPIIQAAAAAECDPQVVEMSALSLFNAAASTGRVPGQGHAAFVHVLDDQILFLLTEDGSLKTVRSLMGGTGTLTRALERGLGQNAGLPEATRQLGAGDAEFSDQELEDDDLVVLQDDVPAALELSGAEIGQDLADQHIASFVERIVRDLRRTVFSLRLQRNTPVFLSGNALQLPGLFERIGTVFGNEVERLDLLGSMEHHLDLSPEELDEASDRAPIALGAALHMLGSDFVGCNFRQEELRFARTFELLKVPLAFAFFLLFLFLALENVYLFREIERKLIPEQIHEAETAVAILIDADLEYAGYETGRETERNVWKDRMTSRLKESETYEETRSDPPGWPRLNHLIVSRGMKTEDPLKMADSCNKVLRESVLKLQKEMGGAGGEGYSMPPSSLDALWNVFESFDKVQKSTKSRIKLDEISTRLRAASRAGDSDSIEVKLRFVLFTDDVGVAANLNVQVREAIRETGAVVDDDFKQDPVENVGYEYDLKATFESTPPNPEERGEQQ